MNHRARSERFSRINRLHVLAAGAGALLSSLVLSVGLVAQGCSTSGSGGVAVLTAANGASTAAATVAPPAGDAWALNLVDPGVVQGVQSVLRLEVLNGFGAAKSIKEVKFKFDKNLGYTLVRAVPPPGWVLDKQKKDEFKFKAASGAAEIPPGGSVTILLYVVAPATPNGNVLGDTFKEVKAQPAKNEKSPVSGVPSWTRYSFQATLDAAPTTLSVGDTVTLTLTVTNRLTVTRSGIVPAAPTVTGTAAFSLLTGPSPATQTLAAGATGTFTWTYQATSNGTSVFEASASSSTGAFASTPPARSPPVVVSDFTARLGVSPTSSMDGGSVTVTMIVENRTGGKLFGVTPGALTNVGGATATLLTGPTPATADVRNDSAVAFVWTYRVAGWLNSTYQLQGSATGPGGLETNMAITPVGMIVNVTAVANPSLVTSGATSVDIAFTITNGSLTDDLKEFKIYTPNTGWTRSGNPFGNDTSGWKTSVKQKNGVDEYKFKENGTKLGPGQSITFTITFASVPTVTAFRTDVFPIKFKGDFDGYTSASVTIAPPPTITAFVPGEAPWGAVVNIIGTNFDPNPAGNTVTFSTGVTTTVLAASSTQLTVIVPPGAITGVVSVATGAGTAISPMDFVVLKGKPNGGVPIALPVSGWVWAVASDPARRGRAYLAFSSPAPRVTVLDTTGAMAVVRDIPYGISTQTLAVPRRGTAVYTVDRVTYRLAEIDSDTGTVLNEFITGVTPFGVSLSQGDTRATVCNIFGFSLSVLDLSTGLGVELPLGANTNPQFGATLPGDRDVLISHWYSGLLSRVDTALPAVTDQITLGPATDQGYEEIVVTGGRAFISQYLTNEVVVVDLTTRAVLARVPTGLNPYGIALTPDETQLWVANVSDDTITIIDTTTLAVTSSLSLTPGVFPFVIKFDLAGSAIIGGNSVVLKIE